MSSRTIRTEVFVGIGWYISVRGGRSELSGYFEVRAAHSLIAFRSCRALMLLAGMSQSPAEADLTGVNGKQTNIETARSGGC